MAYLVDSWDEEDIQEIRKLLSKPLPQTEHGHLRSVLKKILRQVTRGVDMSPLFMDIVKLCATVDIIEKKLAYLYMTTYAHKKPDLALLAVNTIQKDCRDANPMIRGLALKTLCSLRLPELIEYTRQPLLAGLQDRSAYVRRVAVLGCVKIHHINPQFTEDHGVVNTLYEMLRDGDVIVVTNCLLALEELLQQEGGMAINQRIAHYLVNRLSEFTEWGQCCVLPLLLKYRPQTEEEMFDVMNVIDVFLKHTNSGVCMAAVRLMLHLARDLPDISQDVYKRLKGPLVNLLSSDRPELVYASLCHLEWLNGRAPGKLSKHYKKFFCRYNDPGYVKFKKVKLLATLCTEESLKDIVEELSVYATDISVQLSQLAISSLGRLAKMNPAFALPCVEALSSLLSLHLDSVSSQILVVFQDILSYEHLRDHIPGLVERLPACEHVIQEPRGKAALVWLLTQHGQNLSDAPYLLESMIDSLEEEPSTLVKLSLLTATTKLFFARPAECQDMLGKVLEHCIEASEDPDLQEKAQTYYRLLSKDVQKAKDIICTSQPQLPVPSAFQAAVSVLSDLKHFNSMSLLFGADKWQEIQQLKLDGEADDYSESEASIAAPKPTEESTASVPETGQLLDLDGVTTEVSPDVTSEVVPEVKFIPAVSLSPGEFEGKWTTWQSSEARELPLLESISPTDIHTRLEALGCKIMATTPEDSDPWRAFLYAQEATSGQLYLIEVNLCQDTDLLTFEIKCGEGQQCIVPLVMEVLLDAVS
ncbi:AP-4 complex subunit beta-1-like [Acanthaster planci]|uniref:AP-4 complex subunit beta-1-like n=1 Tax=Acanthaster planci TaxID=133434 RepID=A0A8B8A7I8_ACAPL|nr:AP-4 complex subunit beta-1-like [Acanthaster planci]XP_022111996.1 AP-4 complex subunit beta-1-like [Acanthaster planci]XP_022111997.1 AP-4 complex subunit beta-1-like [Acanthaster planci]XP_022111998.1 AP-4 complex subunit beta-1-like [Acanthaster planci]XP_022111999.1 AP-4 complex subunit beta-1-like [Acanthaster planci]